METKPDKPKITVSHFGQKIYRVVDTSLVCILPDKKKVPDYGDEDFKEANKDNRI